MNISFPSTIHWRDCLFFTEYSWPSCQTLIDCVCVGLFLSSWFSPIVQCVCSYASTVLLIIMLFFKSLSHVQLFATLWTVGRQTSLSIGFPRQEYYSGLPFPSPWGLPDPVIKPTSPALAGRFYTTEPAGKPFNYSSFIIKVEIRKRDASCFVLLSQDCFGSLESFVLLCQLYDYFSTSV